MYPIKSNIGLVCNQIAPDCVVELCERRVFGKVSNRVFEGDRGSIIELSCKLLKPGGKPAFFGSIADTKTR